MDTKSYLMGIFDGEGCVGTGRNAAGRYYVQASVTMASEPICRMFVDVWGGGVSKRTKPTVGGLILWTWHVNSSKGIPFLEYVLEHSLTKKAQAEIALSLARNMAKYAEVGYRKGVALSKGRRLISDQDQEERERLVLQIRALNGARSRFATKVATS